jgi:cell division protein FtsI (penicillin-binding protein 3)
MAARLSDVLRSLPARLRLEGTAKQSLEIARHRLVIGGILFVVAFSVVGLRLVDVSLLKEGHEPRLALSRRMPVIEHDRADIVDRDGVVLATSLATASLYANPKLVLDPADAARKLVKVLPDLNEKDVEQHLTSDRSFVWIKRSLTPREEFAVNSLGIPGLFFQREERRVYPFGPLTAHVVGFTDVDNRGLAGAEEYFDDRLKESSDPLQLSIDIRLQHDVHEELRQVVDKFQAIGGAALVLDVQTNEVLALVSLPDFDPNSPGAAPTEARFNRITLGTYEPGSTFKLFNVAAALDTGTTTLSGSYDASKPIHIARFTITDYEPKNRWLSVPEIIMYSSNIGSAKMALDLGQPRQQQYLARFGMLKPATIELPEVAAPQIPNPWHDINVMTVAFGHGIAVTPLQLVVGVSALVNGGLLRPATILKRAPGDVPEGQRVISARTSEEVRELMRLVVTSGTAKLANVPGYLVGGKTGTAEKNINGRYEHHKQVSSFVGAFPINAPKFIVYVMLDEPHGNKSTYGFSTAGWVAVPAAGQLVNEIATLYGIPPVDPTSVEFRDANLINVAVR